MMVVSFQTPFMTHSEPHAPPHSWSQNTLPPAPRGRDPTHDPKAAVHLVYICLAVSCSYVHLLGEQNRHVSISTGDQTWLVLSLRGIDSETACSMQSNDMGVCACGCAGGPREGDWADSEPPDGQAPQGGHHTLSGQSVCSADEEQCCMQLTTLGCCCNRERRVCCCSATAYAAAV